jgi:glutamate formiminotransferase
MVSRLAVKKATRTGQRTAGRSVELWAYHWAALKVSLKEASWAAQKADQTDNPKAGQMVFGMDDCLVLLMEMKMADQLVN